MTTASWNVYVDPSGNEGKREIVETCPTNNAAKEIVEYCRARLPETDRVTTTWGYVEAPGGRFDYSRLREPQNDWPDAEQPAPGKPITI